MSESYVSSVAQDAKMILVYCVIVVLSFFAVVSYETAQEKFVIVIFSLTALLYYYSYTSGTIAKANTTVSKFGKEEAAITNTDFSVEKVYQIHKKPNRFKYIYVHDDLMKVVDELAFLKTFDSYAYEKFVVLLEHFFRIYYKVLTEEYSGVQFYPMLKDLRLEIVNVMSEFYFNVPQFSNNTKGNIFEKIDLNTKKIRAITFRCMKIVSHQAKKLHNVDILYNDPSPADPHENRGKLFA